MTTQNIGVARASLELDLDQYTVAINSATTLIGGLSEGARRAFDASDAKTQTATKSLLRYAQGVGKTADEMKLLRAAWNGVDPGIIKEAAEAISTARQQAALATHNQDMLNQSWREMQQRARDARKELEAVARAEQEAAAARVAARQADLDAGNARWAAEQKNNYLREQQRVVEALTQQYHQLEAAERQAQAGQDFVRQLETRANAIGKTNSELMEMKAAQLGVSAEAAPFIAKMRAEEMAVTGLTNATNRYGLSAKQQVAAMRQVPMQITDIFVSLAGGMNPMMVLIQQGGQLKDVFGGVMPAISGLASGLAKLVNPITLIGAGVGGLAFITYKAEQEQSKLNQSLALTNNYANVTATEMQNLASSMNDMYGESYGKAIEAISKVIGTGKFIGDEIEMVTLAAEKMRLATGRNIDETISEFERLKGDPVNAILELNDKYHFLEEATYKQIVAFAEQGNSADASALALQTYSDNVSNVTDNISENIGYLEQMARWVKEIWAGIVDGVMSIGRATTMMDKVKQQKQYLNAIDDAIQRTQDGGWGKWTVDSRFYGMTLQQLQQKRSEQQLQLERLVSFANGEAGQKPAGATGIVGNSRDVKARENANKQWEAETDRNLTKREQQAKEEQRIIRLGKAAGKSQAEVDAAITASRARFNEAETKRNKRSRRSSNAAGNRADREAMQLAQAQAQQEIASIKNVEEERKAALNNAMKLVRAMYSANEISAEAYYATQIDAVGRELRATENSINAQIAVLQKRNVVGKDAVQVQTQIADLEAKLTQARKDANVETELLRIAENKRIRDLKNNIDDFKEALKQATDQRRADYDAQALSMLITQKEMAYRTDLNAVYAEGKQKLADLQKQLRDGQINQATYDTEKMAVEDYVRNNVRVVQDGYAAMARAQKDWLTGASAGIGDWLDQAGNHAAQTRDMAGRMLDSMTDSMSNFAMTAKFEWQGLLQEIGSMLVKFFMKKAVMQFVQYFLGMMAGSSNPTIAKFGNNALGIETFAHGDVFANSPSLSAHSNTVVNKPTPFFFAKGAGVFGEAGPEAIMPLTRGADGNLGVRAHGMGGGPINVSVVTNVTSSGVSSEVRSNGEQRKDVEQFTGTMKQIALGVVQRALLPGGDLYKAGVRAQ